MLLSPHSFQSKFLSFRKRIDIRLESPNVSMGWQRKMRKNQTYGKIVRFIFNGSEEMTQIRKRLEEKESFKITLTRWGKRKMDEDNLIFAFKPIRDTLAAILIPGLAAGQADGDNRLKWAYEQKKGPSSIEVLIESFLPLPSTPDEVA